MKKTQKIMQLLSPKNADRMPGSFGKPQDDYSRHPELVSGSPTVKAYDNRETSPTGQTNQHVIPNLFRNLLPSGVDSDRKTKPLRESIDRSQSTRQTGLHNSQARWFALSIKFGMTSRLWQDRSSRLGFQPNKAAFTLAEVLITIGIIGVIAAITIPIFTENLSMRVNTERQVNIVQKITQATDKMKALDKLGHYNSTDEFVDELQKHMKITKRCDSEHIADCWPTDTATSANGEKIEIKNVKTGKDLGLFKRGDNKNVGIVLADGASIILSYNQDSDGITSTEPLTASNIVLPVSNSKNKNFAGYTTNSTADLAFVMDVNGRGKPNTETQANKYHDIRNFNGASLGGCSSAKVNGTCYHFVSSYKPISCANGENTKFCGDNPSGSTSDYWAGGNKACDDLGLKMATTDQLYYYASYFLKTPQNKIIDTSTYWGFYARTETPGSAMKNAQYVNVTMNNGNGQRGSASKTSSIFNVICVDKD